jgi:hypothetical protein
LTSNPWAQEILLPQSPEQLGLGLLRGCKPPCPAESNVFKVLLLEILLFVFDLIVMDAIGNQKVYFQRMDGVYIPLPGCSGQLRLSKQDTIDWVWLEQKINFPTLLRAGSPRLMCQRSCFR